MSKIENQNIKQKKKQKKPKIIVLIYINLKGKLISTI